MEITLESLQQPQDNFSKCERRNFIGDDLATTLAVRNGFSIARPDGSFVSICGSCGMSTTSACWGRDCYSCKMKAVDPHYKDQRLEQMRNMGLE